MENVGGMDRKVRMALGVLLVALGAAGYAGVVPLASIGPQALTSVAVTLVGLVLLVTGYFRSCMLYRLIGVDTSEE